MFKPGMILGLLLTLFTVASSAQQATDFSGVWASVKKPGAQLVWIVEQSKGAVTLRETVDNRQIRVTTWKLGAAAPVASVGVSGLAASTKATLVGTELHFDGQTATTVKGQSAPLRQTWSLDSRGEILNVLRVVEVGPGSTLTSRQSFERVR